MATVKSKLSHTTVAEQTGDIFYQTTQCDAIKKIETSIHLFADEGNTSRKKYSINKRCNYSECNMCILDFMQNQIRLMRNSNRLGTAQNYEKTLKNFSQFLGGVNLPFTKG